MAAQDLNLDLIASSVGWVMIGLLAYWARKSHRPKGLWWLLVYAIIGAPMLVLVSWDYIKAGEAARLEIARRRGGHRAATANASLSSAASQSAKRRPRKKGSRHR